MKPAPLIVILGATASGKSRLALNLAQRLNRPILGADSRQIYRGFDIGTAKPSQEEQAQVPHYLIDICEPTETLTLAQYQAQANTLIQRLGLPLILVGGTGLYIKAVADGLIIPPVAPQPQLRQALTHLGQPHCYQLLQQVDPQAAKKIQPADQTRTLRALEVYYVTGRPISQQQGQAPPPFPVVKLGLAWAPEVLAQRIEARTQSMIEQGLVEEVKQLEATYGADLPLLKTLGYAEIQAYLRGEYSLTEAIQAISLHTRQFAKRQRTWFRADPQIHWLPGESDLEVLAERSLAQIFINGR
ncbi:MAG: tRNA (adenosine(37)-N6)-dimethylallyltransferase MiaA [Cyanobacteriota bacterium]|nr:tRNA (adenosine(37)-N6)-dimethylallyltransferase MiaA [Cyanobacteriota bacterium]